MPSPLSAAINQFRGANLPPPPAAPGAPGGGTGVQPKPQGVGVTGGRIANSPFGSLHLWGPHGLQVPGAPGGGDAGKDAIGNAQGLIGQGWNPAAIQQYLASRQNSGLGNVGGFTPNAAGGTQSFTDPKGVNPQLWRYLSKQPDTGGVGAPTVNPGGLTGNLPTYLTPGTKGPKNAGGGTQRFK
jgi:hypothetical protein